MCSWTSLVLHSGDCVLQGTCDSIWRHSWLSVLVRGNLTGTVGKEAREAVKHSVVRGKVLHSKENYSTHSIRSPEVEKW